MGVGGLCHAPAALTAGKVGYPLYRRLGRPQGWPGWVQKTLPPPGFDSKAAQPIACRYTNYAILGHVTSSILKFLNQFPQH